MGPDSAWPPTLYAVRAENIITDLKIGKKTNIVNEYYLLYLNPRSNRTSPSGIKIRILYVHYRKITYAYDMCM